MKRRILAAGLALATLLPLAVGCSGAPGADSGGGKLVIYTSMKENLIKGLVDGFKAANTNIQVEYQSAGAGKLMSKIAAERESGKILADIIWTSEVPDFYSMKADGILAQYKPVGSEAALNPLKNTEDYFTPARLGTLGIAYNTTKVTTPPTSWNDLKGASFKNAFQIADPSQSGTSFVSVAMLQQLFGDQFFTDLRANGASVGSGSGAVVDSAASGEINGALAVDYITFDKIDAGATLAMAYPQEMMVIPSPIAMFKDSAAPEAAKKFLDYMMTKEAQQIVAESGTLPVLKDVTVPAKYNIPSAADALQRGVALDYEAMMSKKEALVTSFLKIMQAK